MVPEVFLLVEPLDLQTFKDHQVYKDQKVPKEHKDLKALHDQKGSTSERANDPNITFNIIGLGTSFAEFE